MFKWSVWISGMILALAFAGCSSGGNHAISGTVTDGGSGLEGVTMTLDNGNTTTTDSNGDYKFKDLADGSYTITPSDSGETFTPADLTVSIDGADVTDIDFVTGSGSTTFTISGTVSSGGAGLEGVTIDLSGAATNTTTTDSNGAYSFTGLSNGSYTITPSSLVYSFDPASQAVTINGADITSVDFTAL